MFKITFEHGVQIIILGEMLEERSGYTRLFNRVIIYRV